MGVTPPSLYTVFGSKEQLYREALDRYGATLRLLRPARASRRAERPARGRTYSAWGDRGLRGGAGAGRLHAGERRGSVRARARFGGGGCCKAKASDDRGDQGALRSRSQRGRTRAVDRYAGPRLLLCRRCAGAVDPGPRWRQPEDPRRIGGRRSLGMAGLAGGSTSARSMRDRQRPTMAIDRNRSPRTGRIVVPKSVARVVSSGATPAPSPRREDGSQRRVEL